MVDAMANTAMKTLPNMNFYMMANEREWNRKQAAAYCILYTTNKYLYCLNSYSQL